MGTTDSMFKKNHRTIHTYAFIIRSISLPVVEWQCHWQKLRPWSECLGNTFNQRPQSLALSLAIAGTLSQSVRQRNFMTGELHRECYVGKV